MRAVALVLIVSLSGCSFLMASKRLKEPPEKGEPPQCDTNAVIPTVDLVVGVTAAAIGIGSLLGDGGFDERAELAVIGGVGVAYLAGWWVGRKWHHECQDAKRAYRERDRRPM